MFVAALLEGKMLLDGLSIAPRERIIREGAAATPRKITLPKRGKKAHREGLENGKNPARGNIVAKAGIRRIPVKLIGQHHNNPIRRKMTLAHPLGYFSMFACLKKDSSHAS